MMLSTMDEEQGFRPQTIDLATNPHGAARELLRQALVAAAGTIADVISGAEYERLPDGTIVLGINKTRVDAAKWLLEHEIYKDASGARHEDLRKKMQDITKGLYNN